MKKGIILLESAYGLFILSTIALSIMKFSTQTYQKEILIYKNFVNEMNKIYQ